MKGRLEQAEADFRDIQILNLGTKGLGKVFQKKELEKLWNLNKQANTELKGIETNVDNDHHAINSENDEKGVFWMVTFFFLTKLVCASLSHGQVTAISNTMGNNNGVPLQTIGVMTGNYVGVIISALLIEHRKVGRYQLILGNFIFAAVFFVFTAIFGLKYSFLYFYLTEVNTKISFSVTNIHKA